MREMETMPIPTETLLGAVQLKLKKTAEDLSLDYESNKHRKETTYKTTGKVIYDEYYPRLAKPLIDQIDSLLAQHYGFTHEELDFIINYDIKYRMGKELNSGEDNNG
jgi:hypothetical protein